MASKNQKATNRFPDALMREWENSDGVNFAVALARATDWLLHVDWWTEHQDDPVEKMRSLRVYVGTDGNSVYDFNGKKGIEAYNMYVIQPLVIKRKYVTGGVISRYYSEEKLWDLPLRVRPSEAGIAKAEVALRDNPSFLAKIPARLNPKVPAHLAAEFTFGACAVFAATLHELSGLPAVAITVQRYVPTFSLTKIGYCHSVVVHPDGDWEDAWGKQQPENILSRHGIAEFTLSEQEQTNIAAKLRMNSPQEYAKYDMLARTMLTAYR